MMSTVSVDQSIDEMMKPRSSAMKPTALCA